MRMSLILASGLSLVLTSCGPAEVEADAPPRLEEAGPDECGVAENASLVGAPVSAFNEAAWPNPVRIIPPGGIVTTEYNPKRLNVDLNSRNEIVRFWCG
ncbi:I78 family peptidase inhibitor [Roseovarius rhodophyticola]|uniref:I78 family peptidase inhibitor n=1 Tax=Roseovarius rhodophyticola TaxID=3080827 RepID=A0ABZ2TEY5_9RHOB|nr:I78 family peptidase inhibitor [Roseovarius sp. W115]MDV2930357.1 I78 family peptidase inhibitor [Roseovarius sp. W115]